MKNQVKRSVNKGMNASTPREFLACATEDGGVVNTSALIGHLDEEFDKPEQKIPHMTEYNHFEFDEYGITMFRHSNIGCGLFHKLDFPEPMAQEFKYEKVDPQRRTYKEFKQVGQTEELTGKEKEEAENPPEPEPLEEGEDPLMRGSFLCHNEMCDNKFDTYQELERHYTDGTCSLTLTVGQTVKKMWTSLYSRDVFQHLTPQANRSHPTFLTPLELVKVLDSIPRGVLAFDPVFEEGWAIKKRKPNVTFTAEQVAFCRKEFEKGEKDKHKKALPDDVAMRMRRVKKDDPINPGLTVYRFQKSDWLTPQQIRSMFGKFRRERTEKGKKATIVHFDEEEAEEYSVQEFHREVHELEDRANDFIPIEEQDHPFQVSFKCNHLKLEKVLIFDIYRFLT